MIIMTAVAVLEGDEDKVFMMNLYQEYYGLVKKTVYNITRDADHAADLTNDTFIRLIEKISVIRTLESCKLAAYIVYTARSVAINFIKHLDVQKKHTYYGKDMDLAERIPELANILDERIIHQEEITELRNAILELPVQQKDVLYLKYILDLNDAEIAGILGIAPDSVRQYLTRARRNAKELLDKELMEREMNKHAK
jgi:RNA polymerase sigma-70 factor (ECF subfamily)